MTSSGKNNITDVWNISSREIQDIYENLLKLESNLMKKHKGRYFDYQLVDKMFSQYSDIEKAMIFLYGQWVHKQFYLKNL
jgi:hypothetical protein